MENQKSKIKSQNYNNKYKLITFVSFFLTFNFALLTFNLRHATAQSLSLSISPPLLEVFIKPGKSITQKYKLTNNGEPTLISLKLAELNEYGINLENSSSDKWISIIDSDIVFNLPFALENGQAKEFVLKIQPSSQLKEQDYYRALVFSTESSYSGQTTASTISQNLVSPVLITLTSTGQVNKAAKISRFEIPRFLDSFGPLKVNIFIENIGNIYFRPNGDISLEGPLAKGNFKIEPNIVLPETLKILKTASSLDMENTLNLPGIYLGKYNLKVGFTLDEGNIRIDQTRTFYALPWKAGLFLLFLYIFVLILRKLRKRKK